MDKLFNIISRFFRRVYRNFNYVFFSKEFQALIIKEPIKENDNWTYKLRELGFDNEIFTIVVSKKIYSKNDIIYLGLKK